MTRIGCVVALMGLVVAQSALGDVPCVRYSCALEAIELIDPSLRQKYLERLEVCFGKYLDPKCRKVHPRAATRSGVTASSVPATAST